MNKQTYLDRIAEAKSEHIICSDDEADDACKFVAKLIQLEIERLQEDEPYAVNAINVYEVMESTINSFFDYTIANQLEEFDNA